MFKLPRWKHSRQQQQNSNNSIEELHTADTRSWDDDDIRGLWNDWGRELQKKNTTKNTHEVAEQDNAIK